MEEPFLETLVKSDFKNSQKPEILFIADQNNGNIGTKVFDFGDPLFGDVLQGVGRIDREAHQYDIRIGIGQGSKSIIIFLTSSIPKGQLNLKNVFDTLVAHN